VRQSLRLWLVVTIGWTALALFFAISASLTYLSTGREANWTLSIERSLLEWWTWALFTPIVVWLARRYSLDRAWPWQSIVVHLLVGTSLAVIKSGIDRAVNAWLTGFWMYWLASTVALQFAIYCVIVAAAHGIEYYERSRERDLLAARLAEVRLQLLSMQLQPHFLFNTLNTIAELVHDDPDAADRMIAALSDLLRKTLEVGSAQEISLNAELQLLDRYIDIQQARFGERLRVTVDTDSEARAAAVPVLLLQPLVENAIRHGLAEQLAAGRIEIGARRNGSRLVISVVDDGPGPTPGTTRNERVGLGNTRQRLDALYGPDHRFDLANAGDRGARVSIDIPFKTAVAS
jgi:two-component system, LytTR family, sensor kinase